MHSNASVLLAECIHWPIECDLLCIPDSSIYDNAYNLVSKDRKDTIGGGVLSILSKNIEFS